MPMVRFGSNENIIAVLVITDWWWPALRNVDYSKAIKRGRFGLLFEATAVR